MTYQLKVINIEKTIEEASVLTFEVPPHLAETFEYKPGQYLTLQFNLNGDNVRRSYSLCSAPTENHLQVGVKRVKNGLVSNHINDNIKIGDLIDVLPPDGRFYAEVAKKNYKTYYLFGAGSGITPMLSILKTVLHTEPKSYVNLIYGNKHQDSIMFKQELEKLQAIYADRLIVVHSLSSPKQKWSDMWNSNRDKDFRTGRVDADAIQWFLNTYPPYAQNAEYFICGPGKMIENTRKVLRSLDVPESRIFIESFGGVKKEITSAIENAILITNLDGEEIETIIHKGKTILQALLDNGNKPPYSCEGGVCGTCQCKLIKGKVDMSINLALTEKEVEDGYILSCQAIPLTEEVEVEYVTE